MLVSNKNGEKKKKGPINFRSMKFYSEQKTQNDTSSVLFLSFKHTA